MRLIKALRNHTDTMAEREPLNPWKISGYRPGQLLVCKITTIEPDGTYEVHIRKDNLFGILCSNAKYTLGQEVIAEYKGVQQNKTHILLSIPRPEASAFVDRTKCREFDRKIAEANSISQAQLIAVELLEAITVEQESKNQEVLAKKSILTALILNVARFCLGGEHLLRRIRDMLNVDIDSLESLLQHESDEQQLFLEFKRTVNPLKLLDELSAQLGTIVQYPPRGTRSKT